MVATAVAVISLVAVALAAFLMFLRPHWVFYLLIVSALFGNILGGYVYVAGNLGLPRAWQPADLLAWLTLLGTLLLPRRGGPRNGLHRCFTIIAAAAAVALVLGIILYPHTALTYSRALHFVPAMLFGVRYFRGVVPVERFLGFATWLLFAMFLVHLCIRFGLYVPPLAQEEGTGQLAGERGEFALLMVGYLVLLSVGIGRLAHKRPLPAISVMLIFTSLAGIVLSETRTLYAAAVFLGMTALLFVRGRVKTVLVYGLAVAVALVGAAQVGFDVTARFRTKYGKGQIVIPLSGGSGWRTMEYGILWRTYLKEPLFVLTGRGIGATHYVPLMRVREAGSVGYYHSEYLSWLDRTGLIGFTAYLTMLGFGLVHSYRLAKSRVQPLAYYGTTAFLLTAALVVQGINWTTFMHPRGAPLYICFVVIIANWRTIDQNKTRTPAVEPETERTLDRLAQAEGRLAVRVRRASGRGPGPALDGGTRATEGA